eukprot:TRINITY_DN4611_c0_g1_i1.p1 TRINITY_DN4611_c0_g1~~TRINITY_DN4611_c0_g1_i1.p1  ORF type:complete len:241 (+),score=56.52 TRINITY_DN4611_c0_g1_i1:60-725(+)
MAAQKMQMRIKRMWLTGDAERGPPGGEYVVYAVNVLWECPDVQKPGGGPFQHAAQIERRYSEFYALYYALAEHEAAYYGEFPRRVLWGSTSRDVVDYRMGALGEWLRIVCNDPAASADPKLLQWAGVDAARAVAEQRSRRFLDVPQPPSPPPVEVERTCSGTDLVSRVLDRARAGGQEVDAAIAESAADASGGDLDLACQLYAGMLSDDGILQLQSAIPPE